MVKVNKPFIYSLINIDIYIFKLNFITTFEVFKQPFD